MRVGRWGTGRIEIKDVTRLGHRFGPRSGRHGKKLNFDYALLVTQQLRVGLDVGKHTTDIGCLLRAAMRQYLSRSIGGSHILRARVDASRVGQISRAD